MHDVRFFPIGPKFNQITIKLKSCDSKHDYFYFELSEGGQVIPFTWGLTLDTIEMIYESAKSIAEERKESD